MNKQGNQLEETQQTLEDALCELGKYKTYYNIAMSEIEKEPYGELQRCNKCHGPAVTGMCCSWCGSKDPFGNNQV